MKFNMEKCSFAKQQIEYLGYVVTPEGLFPDPIEVEVIMNFPTLTTVKEWKSFLGLANYYQHLIKGFSEIASVLDALTKKGIKFCWSELCTDIFNQLKPTVHYQNLTTKWPTEISSAL